MDKAELFDLLYGFVGDVAAGDMSPDDVVRQAKEILARANAGPVALCGLCGEEMDAAKAHLHQDQLIGDECCWDERLRSTE